MAKKKKRALETTGLELLAQERPDLLLLICRDRFLPPTQLIYALQELEWYPDKKGMAPLLVDLLGHDSLAVARQAARTLGLDEVNGPEAT